MDWLALFVAALLLLLNAFFVLAEFAIVKVRSSRVEELVRQGGLNAMLLKRITSNLDAYLSVIQLGITMASLGIGWLGEPAMARLLEPLLRSVPGPWARAASGTLSFAAAFALITFLHVVLGELAPKSIAIRRSTRAAIFAAAPLHLFYRLFFFPMYLLNGASNLILRMVGLRSADKSESSHSDEELKILLAQSQESGVLPLSRLLLFENLFDFGYTRVGEVMRKASDVAFLTVSASWEENLAVVRQRKFSRYPLCGEAGLQDVRGVVHFKDAWLSGADEVPDLAKLSRSAVFLPEDAPLERALIEFRQKRCHLALVRGKDARVCGLLTLEDVIEELVGEIRDEFEPPPPILLADIISSQAVQMELPASGKEEVLRRLMEAMVTARPDIPFEEAWQIVWRREQTFNSALGGGIALFHGRLARLDKPALAIGRSRGLDFGAPDKKPVRLVFLLLTSLKEPGVHLRLLSRIAQLSSEETFRRNLLRARSTGEVLDVLQAFGHSRA